MSESNPSAQQPIPDETLPAAAEAAPAAQDASAGDVQERLDQAAARIAELEDAWLRARAEVENVRRRSAEEIDKARKFALERFSADLLAVKDSLEAALAVGDTASMESLKSGVELTLKQLASVFDKYGIVEVNPVDARFDPNLHQAVGMVEGEGEANTVARVLQKGYCLNDRVIRPALVMVRKGDAPAEQDASAT